MFSIHTQLGRGKRMLGLSTAGPGSATGARTAAVSATAPALPALPSSGRRTDITCLRVLAVLLLFPFHTARVFDVFDQFYVKNDHLSDALSYFIAYMEPWHMPLLFLLAGAASWYALGRRTGGHYAGERVKRLLVPFIFGLLVLIPPQSYLGLLSHAGSAPGFFQWLPDFFHLNGEDMDGYFLGGHTWGHLWFIIHLFMYALLALPVMLFLRRGAGRKVVDLLTRAARVPGVILLFALALVPARYVPDIAGGDPAFYIAIFLLGYLMVSDARFEVAIDRHKLVALVLGPVACLAAAYFEVAGWPAMPEMVQGPLDVYLGLFMPWFFMIALLGYGRRFLGAIGATSGAGASAATTGDGAAAVTRTRGAFSRRALAYADEASYPIYLLHQTVIVAVAYLAVRWEVGTGAKFAAILLGSLLVTTLIYEVVVRRVGVTRFLFGMKPLRRGAAKPAAAADLPTAPVPSAAGLPTAPAPTATPTLADTAASMARTPGSAAAPAAAPGRNGAVTPRQASPDGAVQSVLSRHPADQGDRPPHTAAGPLRRCRRSRVSHKATAGVRLEATSGSPACGGPGESRHRSPPLPRTSSAYSRMANARSRPPAVRRRSW